MAPGRELYHSGDGAPGVVTWAGLGMGPGLGLARSNNMAAERERTRGWALELDTA